MVTILSWRLRSDGTVWLCSCTVNAKYTQYSILIPTNRLNRRQTSLKLASFTVEVTKTNEKLESMRLVVLEMRRFVFVCNVN